MADCDMHATLQQCHAQLTWHGQCRNCVVTWRHLSGFGSAHLPPVHRGQGLDGHRFGLFKRDDAYRPRTVL